MSAAEGSVGHRLALALRGAYLALHRETGSVLEPFDVTADQFVVLWALSGGEAGSQRELVGRTGSDPSTLRAMLVLLEERGYVERRPHPRDRRARSVRLTPRGRSMFTRMWTATDPVRERLAAALRPGELERTTSALSSVINLLGRSHDLVQERN